MPDNVVRIEPLMLAMFCIYQNLQVVLPHVNVSEQGYRVVSGPLAAVSTALVHYSATKCHCISINGFAILTP